MMRFVPTKLAGAFVNWGPVGRERMLQSWEKWLNQAPTSVVGLDFYAENTWDDFTRLSWVPGIWKKLNPERNVVIGGRNTVFAPTYGWLVLDSRRGLQPNLYSRIPQAWGTGHPYWITEE